jgi:hypothetical protein
MGYLGTKPANSPLTSELIPNSIITNDKIAAMAASKLTGQVADANAPSGSVLQVVNVSSTTALSTASSSWSDLPGLSASITPISSSSKILVTICVGAYALSNAIAEIQLLRNGSSILVNGFWLHTGGAYTISQPSQTWLDSPSTTSSITYKIQGRSRQNTINYTYSDGNGQQVSSLTLMEIAG